MVLICLNLNVVGKRRGHTGTAKSAAGKRRIGRVGGCGEDNMAIGDGQADAGVVSTPTATGDPDFSPGMKMAVLSGSSSAP